MLRQDPDPAVEALLKSPLSRKIRAQRQEISRPGRQLPT
jgi:hypothetical protein